METLTFFQHFSQLQRERLRFQNWNFSLLLVNYVQSSFNSASYQTWSFYKDVQDYGPESLIQLVSWGGGDTKPQLHSYSNTDIPSLRQLQKFDPQPLRKQF